MNYYNYSGKKSQSRFKSNRKKIIINVLIIVGAIVLSVAAALILGNHLKKKLQTAELSTEPIENLLTPVETEAPAPADEIDFVKNDRPEGAMSAVFAYLDLAGCPDEENAQKFVYAMKENGYTGLIFDLRGKTGKYSYASKAASELSRTETPVGVVPFDCLNGAVYASRELGMRSCAYIDLGDVFLSDDTSAVRRSIDRAVIKEVAEMGFSEIVFGGVLRDRELTTDFAKQLYGFVSALRSDCPGTDFGLEISPSVIEDPEKTPALELVFRYVDFFAIDLSNGEIYTPEAIAELREKYSGSFGEYSILSFLDGSDLDKIQSGYASFSAAKAPNIAFITPKTDYEAENDEAGEALYSSKFTKYSLVPEIPDDTSNEDAAYDE